MWWKTNQRQKKKIDETTLSRLNVEQTSAFHISYQASAVTRVLWRAKASRPCCFVLSSKWTVLTRRLAPL